MCYSCASPYVYCLGEYSSSCVEQVITVGVVGGSDLIKIKEQLGKTGIVEFSAYPLKFKLRYILITRKWFSFFFLSKVYVTIANSQVSLCAADQDYDYVFSENGLVAHKEGKLIGNQVP